MRASRSTQLLLQGGTRPTHATHPRRQAPPSRTHAAAETPAAHPCRTCAPRMQERPEHTRPLMHPVCPQKQGFLHMAACARDSGDKITASAHDMGSGYLAVDAMVIGCLGVERRAERFLSYLAIFSNPSSS